MKVGFDVDGVLADFTRSFQPLLVKVTGRDLFQPDDINNPPCWNWDTYRGYSAEESKKAWDAVRRDDTFWMNLAAFESNVATLRQVIKELERKHEVYFVTSRSGMSPKKQTSIWLYERLHYFAIGGHPTVLISSEKGEVAHALKLDAYVDDNFDNACDVVRSSPQTTTYLLNKSYNVDFDWQPAEGNSYIRIETLGQMFDKEIAKGRL